MIVDFTEALSKGELLLGELWAKVGDGVKG
jgi:hypothetical protein